MRSLLFAVSSFFLLVGHHTLESKWIGCHHAQLGKSHFSGNSKQTNTTYFAPSLTPSDPTYVSGEDCTYSFSLTAGTAVNLLVEVYDVEGSMDNNCQGGDYLQYSVNGGQSIKICGKTPEGEEVWYKEYLVGPYDWDTTVQGLFHSTEGGKKGRLFCPLFCLRISRKIAEI